jgi:hypothetical protein
MLNILLSGKFNFDQFGLPDGAPVVSAFWIGGCADKA